MRPTVLQLGKNQVARSSPTRIRSTGLIEVGQFQEEQASGNCYAVGQSFVHRVFGYRGIILFQWQARVHDMDLSKSHDEATKIESRNIGDKTPSSSRTNYIKPSRNGAAQVQSRSAIVHPYYQVLVDARDQTDTTSRTRKARCQQENKMGTGGLDFVAHEDILPYTSNEQIPIEHELHGKLFRMGRNAEGDTKFIPTDLLDNWRDKHSRLGLPRVHKETTENVRVTVIPFYLGHTSIGSSSFHWWRYWVRLENFNEFEVELRRRNMKVFSQANVLQTIERQEIAGAGPRLTRASPAHQFQSQVNLQHQRGHMWGSFEMESENGHKFESKIPQFYLESPQEIDL